MLLKVKIVQSIITKPEANTEVKKNEVFQFSAYLDLQSMFINVDNIFLQNNVFLTSIIQEGIFFLQALSFIRKAGNFKEFPKLLSVLN